MNVTPDISIGNILTIIVAVAVPTIAFLISLIVLRVTVKMEKTRTDERFSEMDGRIDELGAQLKGVKTGLEAGIGKVQDILDAMAQVLNDVRTKVEILFDRDERDERAAKTARSTTRTRT